MYLPHRSPEGRAAEETPDRGRGIRVARSPARREDLRGRRGRIIRVLGALIPAQARQSEEYRFKSEPGPLNGRDNLERIQRF